MNLIVRLLRICSYLFHLALCLFFVGIATVTFAGGQHNLNLGMMPWKGVELTQWLLGLGILGIITTLAAAFGIFRFGFPLWCLFVVVMIIRGYFLSAYAYNGRDEFNFVLWMLGASVVSLLVSLTLLRNDERAR